MPNILLTFDDKQAKLLNKFSSENWSFIARVEANKRRISEYFKKTSSLLDEDWPFCEEHDWHPIDEYPFKKSFIKKMEQLQKNRSSSKKMTFTQLKEKMNIL